MFYDDLKHALGISKAPRSRMELVDMTRHGLPKRCADAFAKKLTLTNKEIGLLLDISPRQLARLSGSDPLSPSATGRLLSIGKVLAKAIELFGTEERAVAWLKEQIPALGNKTPVSLMDTPEGADMVMEELVAIEHGIFA